MIRLSDVGKRYRGAAQPALDGVSLHVHRGSVFGLLGPNGAGKSTLMSLLTGVQRADRGEVLIDGRALPRDIAAVRPLIGYAPQELAFYPNLTVGENLRLFAALTPGSTPERVARAMSVASLETYLAARAATLSGGLKRRLNFALALLGDPRLLLLDEPTAGVDPQSRNYLLERVRELAAAGMTVVYTSHHMDEIEQVCSRVAVLDGGRVVADAPLAELRGSGDERLEAVFLRLTGRALREPA